jgi:hypothetical protein
MIQILKSTAVGTLAGRCRHALGLPPSLSREKLKSLHGMAVSMARVTHRIAAGAMSSLGEPMLGLEEQKLLEMMINLWKVAFSIIS